MQEDGEITPETLDRILAASQGWTFRECAEALALIDTASAGMLITSTIAGKLQSGIRLRQQAISAGMFAPQIPQAILIPFLGAELQVPAATLIDDLRKRQAVPEELDRALRADHTP